jgi:alanine racemase
MFITPTLHVNLSAITANWQMLRDHFTGEECGAVVKANAYGMGAIQVTGALEKAGCHSFFVATLEEAIALRNAFPDIRILVFHGVQQGEEFAFAQHRIIPVLNNAEQLQRWLPVARDDVHAISALHIDTAMARLGFSPEAMAQLDIARLKDARVSLLMSHFACASDADHPSNIAQLDAFLEACARVPHIPRSICNSAGIFLPDLAHGDLARPGCALYGIRPGSSGKSPMRHVAEWRAPVIQTRTLHHAQAVGYGATQTLPAGTTIATVASGYADGFFRLLSHKATGYLHGTRVPLVGRVTMDMLCFDITGIDAAEGDDILLLGEHDGIRVDDLADTLGTIGYEILCAIGPRVKRVYM